MEYCQSYNGASYHSQYQGSEFHYRNVMKSGFYENQYMYGHHHQNTNQNHQHTPLQHHHHHHQQQHQQQQHINNWNPTHQYGNRTTVKDNNNLYLQQASQPQNMYLSYDSYKLAQQHQNNNQNQSSFPPNHYSSSYEYNSSSQQLDSTSSVTTAAALYRSRANSYIGCETEQCYPNGNGDGIVTRHEYLSSSSSSNDPYSRCVENMQINSTALSTRGHHMYSQQPIPGSYYYNNNMRTSSNHHRGYESHYRHRSSHDADPNSTILQHYDQTTNNDNTTNGRIHNDSNYHSYNSYQTSMNHPNFSDFSHQSSPHADNYENISNNNNNSSSSTSSNSTSGQIYRAKENKSPIHRDRSLSKLVAMSRRLESQINEIERIGTPYNEHLENFNEFYTNYSPETPDSMACPSQQFAPNDDSSQSKGEADAAVISQEPNLQEENNDETISNESNTQTENHTDQSNNNNSDGTTKQEIKQKPRKKLMKSKKAIEISEANSNPVKRRRRKRERILNSSAEKNFDVKMDSGLIPLPGFQQAFGSIGRFSDLFFNSSECPTDMGLFESEADASSPQTWEMGDSLEGPHISIKTNVTTTNYAESLGSTDSPTASNNSYFSDSRVSEF